MSRLFVSLILACPGAAGAQEVAADLPAGVTLLEAEQLTERVPDDGSFAHPHDDSWASGRACLVRFPRGERATWSFPAAANGPLEVWLRYAASSDVRLTWSAGPPSEEPEDSSAAGGRSDWSEVMLPASGGLSGRGAWRWERLGALPVGATSVSLRGAPLRPDCLLISPPLKSAPGWPLAPEAPRHSPELLRDIAASWSTTPPVWMNLAAAIELPAWYESGRSQLHTRLAAGWQDKEVFVNVEEDAASIGAAAIVRHVKTMAGLCSWPSAVGAVAPWVAEATVDGVDPVAAMASRADAAGVAFVAYYRHQEDRPLAREHPDWVCRDHLGRTVQRAGEPRLCFHSPFGQVTLLRLRELLERGVDGVYLDESHQPLEGCWCEWTLAAFEAETGLPAPAAPLLEDPLYRRFLVFTEDSIARELWRWRGELRAIDPEFILLVSSNRQPELLNYLPTTRMASVGDAVKTELASGARSSLVDRFARYSSDPPSRSMLLSLGWALARDAGSGRPPHVWIHGLGEARRWTSAAGAVVAHGGVANLDHREGALPQRETMGEAHALAGSIGRALDGARPVGRIALHVPEAARNALLPSEKRAWSEVLEPFLRAYRTLLEAHIPMRLLTDDQLAAGLVDGIDLLFLPAPRALTPEQRGVVARLREDGAGIVEGSFAELFLRASQLVRSDLVDASVDAPWQVQASFFFDREGALLIALNNAPGWIIDPLAGPPAPVSRARLLLAPGVEVVEDAATGMPLDVERSEDGRASVRLPVFEDAFIVRVRR